MRKTAVAAEVIEKRIAHADHVLAGIPSERQLAEELGLSRNTVRSAVRLLLDQGVLIRQNNGRLDVAARSAERRKRTIGFVAPIEASWDHDRWHEGVKAALEGQAVTLRPVTYGHWGDPALHDAISSFDGLFLIPPPEKTPDWVIRKLTDTASRVVVLDQDESASGLPSVIMFPVASERKLFDHLYALGHRRIDCVNTQPEDPIILGRIGAWSRYIRETGLTGQLRSRAPGRPIEAAYLLIRECIQESRPLARAIFCTTGPAAIGAMRALKEAGLEIGSDVSVCAVNDEGIGRYLLKSLTALESPPRAYYLRRPMEWMLSGEPWSGPLLVQPDDAPLFVGESTGPASSETIPMNARYTSL